MYLKTHHKNKLRVIVSKFVKSFNSKSFMTSTKVYIFKEISIGDDI